MRFLLQPRIWGSVSVLAVVGIFFWQFSENPEWFSLDAESTLNPSNSGSQLTPEQQAIAADIDNSKVLLEALGSNNSLISPLNFNSEVNKDLLKQTQNTDKKLEPSPRSNPLLDSLFPPSNSTNQPPVGENSPKTSNLPNPVSENSPTTTNSNLGLKGLGSPVTETTNPETAKTSLQQAMQNYLQTQETENTDSAAPSNTNDTSKNSLITDTNSANNPPNSLTNSNSALNPSPGTAVGVTPFTGTPTLTGQVNQPSWSVPRDNPNSAVGTVPLPPINPYQTNVTLPPVVPTVPTVTPGTVPNSGYSNFNSLPLNNTVPSYSVTPNMGINSTVQPNNYITPGNINPNIQQGQIGQTQPNFSVPNRVPGRYIGGGEINTFANP
ncbi:DNA-directed RNA polymerase II subunit RPB1 [Planktothrix agardhii NIVA-CYA 126/8]|uniref:DNA-directed RNA polymerase II subunit RPB1 n=1 Tax=Planktothrix agardhii (strain NIVA-CYA 126/8) TaxID=388467 RepID=A0A073CUR5_PLAA1|nr:DNA-directed RNA polymerase II subunit RPB1 [Planktothrix agardhii NIVA-CYA 126/8]